MAQHALVRSLKQLHASKDPTISWHASQTLNALYGASNDGIQEALHRSKKQKEFWNEVREVWKSNLAGPRSAPAYDENRFAPAFAIEEYGDRMLAVRWHLATFPIPPRSEHPRRQVLEATTALSRLSKQQPTAADMEDINNAIRAIREISSQQTAPNPP